MNLLTVKNCLLNITEADYCLKTLPFHCNKDKSSTNSQNGAGKSSLLKIMQRLELNQSNIEFNKNYSVGFLTQNPEFDPNKSIYEVILSSSNPLIPNRNCLRAGTKGSIGSLEDAMEKMEAKQAWDYEARVKAILTQIQFGRFS
ncbi:MAG: hypothetical protein IPI52_12180 [Bacteroidetes bacterium]|nr:hypothetical protein [Bacteroidota bacterium]